MQRRGLYRRETTRDFLIIPLLFSSYYSWLSRVLFIPTIFSPETSMRLKPPRSCLDMIRSLPSWSVPLLSLQIGNFESHSDFFISFHSSQVRGMPQYGAQYKAAIARMFRDCGRGKALYFEETRSVNEIHTNKIYTYLQSIQPSIQSHLSIYLTIHSSVFFPGHTLNLTSHLQLTLPEVRLFYLLFTWLSR